MFSKSKKFSMTSVNDFVLSIAGHTLLTPVWGSQYRYDSILVVGAVVVMSNILS